MLRFAGAAAKTSQFYRAKASHLTTVKAEHLGHCFVITLKDSMVFSITYVPITRQVTVTMV